MNNLIIKKLWEDESMLEIELKVVTQFVTAWQKCYINEENIKTIYSKIQDYCNDFTKDMYIEIGNKEGNYTSAFSMNLLCADSRGHLKIEMDIEIEDIEDRSHRCKCFLNSEIGAMERFAEKLHNLKKMNENEEIEMF